MYCPCITDNIGISSHGLTVIERRMKTGPTVLWSIGHFYVTCDLFHAVMSMAACVKYVTDVIL